MSSWSLVTNLSSLHKSVSGGQTWCFMEEHCTKGAFTGHRPSQSIPVVPEEREKNCPPVSRVMYACAEGNCNRHRQTTVVHGGSIQADKRTGTRGNRRGSGPSAGERTHDGWGAGTPDSLQEIESNSLSAKVAETNGWDRVWVALLWTPRHWCLSGREASPGVLGDLADRVDGWLATSLSAGRGSRLACRDTLTPPSIEEAQTRPILSTVDVFIIKTISWQWLRGEYFIIFFLKWKSILKQCSHVFVLRAQEVQPILNTTDKLSPQN